MTIERLSTKRIKWMKWVAIAITVLPVCAYIGLIINVLIFNLNNSGMSLGQLIGPVLVLVIGLILLMSFPLFLPLIGGWIIIVVYCITFFVLIIPTMLSPHNLNLMFGDPIWMLYAVLVLMPLAGGILFVIVGKWKRYQKHRRNSFPKEV
jgi:hypothetical protein